MNGRRIRSALSLAAALLGACSSGAKSDNPAGPGGNTNTTVTSVVIGGSSSVVFGSTLQLTATALNSSLTAVAGQAFVWSSDNANVATVANGVVTPVSAGTASISATAGGKTASLLVTVTSPAASVQIIGTLALQAGGTTQLTANGIDTNGSPIGGEVHWSSSDPTLLSVDQTGLVTASRIGSVFITASLLGRKGTSTVVSSLTPFTFSTAGASAADAQLVRDAVQEAQKFYQATFNRPIQSQSTIVASASDATCLQRAGNTAYTIPLTVTICTNAQGWTQMGPIMKQKIVIHETFHLLQNETKWIGPNTSPTWLIEGAAELIGFSGVADLGLLPLATGRQCNEKEWFDFNTRGGNMPQLSALETQQAWATVNGPSYNPAFLGADYLTANAPGGVGLAAFKTFWTGISVQGAQWPAVFLSAFGQSNTAFYAAFPPYASALLPTAPAQYPCGGI